MRRGALAQRAALALTMLAILAALLLSACDGAASATPTAGLPPTRIDHRPPGEVFIANGCGACHTITGLPGAVGTLGPNLDNVATQAETRVPSLTGEQYIRQSIEEPQAFVVPGFATLMPSLRNTMIDQEFEDLVAFLLTLN